MHMKSVIKLSQAWIAALFLGLLLSGCGGGSQPSNSGQASQPSDEGSEGTVSRSAALSWNAPGTRENGDSLRMGELAGYVISYGQDSENLTETVRIGEASTMEYTVTNLDNGTWFFTVQVQDDNGLVSEPSPQVSKTI